MVKKVTKLVDIDLSELSLVTSGANQHANISILKSADTDESVELVKYLSTDDGAKTFDAFIIDEQKQRAKSHISEALWTPIYALRDSITSIKLDESLTDDQRTMRITEAVSQFNQFVNPGTSQQLEKCAINSNVLLEVLTEHEDSMSEEVAKKAEALEAQVAELTKSLALAESLAKLSDKERAFMSQLDDEAAEEFRAAAKEKRDQLMNKAAEGDEVFKSVDGMEIRKSAVGPAFDILKSQDEALRVTRAELAKQADRAQTVELMKRAEEEFANLPGETVAKVAVLKGLAGLDVDAQATLTAMLKAGNEALAKGFQSFGVSGGKPQDITKAAKRDELIKAHMAANPNVTKAVAEVAVISAHPELYEG